ncbi:T9SS type A sorting domain-containing protein [Dyadobacter sp. CY326]|uniref:T9SS type A sorting domain-containing protein n=1 Tax=Dyadobacter sp. CY326 TaxID=2907300 RepID=UPI001F3263F1|nr:T9SS type A sorting domain-containing protein [Dyadobacter sp. CY326]MCE7065470.1 T9SS type A sorting domain-containing protein [Dyadobacter sp. CY326]
MTSFCFQFAKNLLVVLLLLLARNAVAQTTFLHQDFASTGPFVDPEPDSGQFSHIVQTAPVLSYSKFHNGYMELVRTQQDSATGGIIRVLRATPFQPNPETLFIQIRMSAEAVQSNALNAIYFYVGDNFNAGNHSFPGNALMFGKFSINFLDDAFTVKDLATQLSSKPIARKKTVTLTWVLNNSSKLFGYKLSPSNAVTYNVLPGTYDLWVDDDPVNLNSKAYPGNSIFSKTKLSNFELRFRNGLGKIRIHEMLIREGTSELKINDVMVAPNPAFRDLITLRAINVDPNSLRLIRLRGSDIPVTTKTIAPDKVEIRPNVRLASGIYIISFENDRGQRKTVKVMIE